MKEYPSIPKEIRTETPIYAFDKLDGSNIRAEWSKKRGFYKFGSKTRLLGPDNKNLGESIGLIQNKYQDDLGSIFTKEKWDNVTCFFEFYGPNSFAGYHPEEKHDVILFDVNLYKHGFVEPEKFLKHFGNLDIPKMLYYGKANSYFEDSVRNGTLADMTFEGVVCKGRIMKKTSLPVMFKIKNKAWLNKLKVHCKDDLNLFQKLA